MTDTRPIITNGILLNGIGRLQLTWQAYNRSVYDNRDAKNHSPIMDRS